MNRRRNTIIVAVVLALVIGASVLAARSDRNVTAVREAVVHYGHFQTKLPETGVIEMPKVITLPAIVSGTLERMLVRPGDRVSAGQLLATIDNAQIVTNLSDASASATSARGRAQSIAQANAALPQQNRAAVLQAQANLVAARSQLAQAQSDSVAGAQSGLGYGGQTAEEQRIAADTALAKAATDLREAKRAYDADTYLYEQKGISKDALMQTQARYQQAQISYDQAASERRILSDTLTRTGSLLRDRVRSSQNAVSQAEAALASARANAAESKAGDLEAAQADAARADADLAFARDQAASLLLRAPLSGIVESVATEPNDSLRPLQPGDAITPSQPVFTIALGQDFVVRTKVDEQDVAGLRLGQHAIIGGEDFGSAMLFGTVLAISPIAQKSDDPSNTARQVVTTIGLTKRLSFLRDGMTVDVDIITHDEPHVLAVPSDALRKDARGSYVFIARRGRAYRTSVKLGAQNDTQTIVTTGLNDGDIVVSDKNAAVTENERIKPAPTPSPQDGSPSPSSL